MILAGILQFFGAILFVLMSPLLVLSDVAPNSAVVASIVTANGYISSVPFPYLLISIFDSLTFLLVFEAVYWSYKGVRWVYRKIPGIT